MTQPTKWFALTDKYKIKYIGKHFTPHDADVNAPANTIMLMDWDDALELRAQLDRHLGKDEYPDALKYAAYPKPELGESK